MSELLSQEKTRQHAGFDEASPTDLAPLPPLALARRRRLVRLAGLLTLVGGLGLSAIPGPKGSSHVQITETENGTTTVVHKFSYYRTYGVPFAVAKTEFDESGEMKSASVQGENFVGLFGNMALALAIVLAGAFVLRRREPRV